MLPVLLLLTSIAYAEHVRHLEISEGVEVGTRIGFIGDGTSANSGPPYLIVPVGSAVDSDLNIDHTTGEIRTKVPLDRETRASYSLVAIPMSGENVKVLVKVLDENDNAPTFPTDVMNIEFPENTPRDVKRTLYPARDLDLDMYNTQRYNIVSGNVNNLFRLSSHRERDGVLYLDLQINGVLDRETTPFYTLVIEALDGGIPPLRGEMIVNITIQDINDNPPVFNQSRYFATVPENATIGSTVLQVFATDDDADENGQIEYSINRRQSDRDAMFNIDPVTGLIAVNKPLDFETKELHELVIVAKDHGLQPLETTAFVSIKVTDVNDNQPTINVIFLSDDATPKISESAQPGEFVARISVNDPDSKTEYSNINVTLSGGDGRFGLTTRDNIIYLVIVSLPLDREIQPNYTLNVVATDRGTPPLHASRTINLQVTDINDNAPEFSQDVYHANVMEVSDPGTSVIQMFADDRDEGNNSAVIYSLKDTLETHSNWFQIDSRSGLITTRAHVDCETDPTPRIVVVATDNGFPPLSSSTTVLVTIHDVNDNEPIFDQSFYNVSIAENETIGKCILKVSATDPDCGINAMVNYTLGDGADKLKEFSIRSDTGEICIKSALDYETRNIFEFPVVATDRGGLSTIAVVKIQITDINDNRPIFYPREYNVSLREGSGSSSSVVVIAATDSDSAKFGTLSYEIVGGNEGGMFRIDRNTGEIFVNNPNKLSSKGQPYYHLIISAMDGGNLKSLKDAEVFISIIDSAQRPPIFEYPRYTYSISENAKKDTLVGTVHATVQGSGNGQLEIIYSIYSGDPDGYFRIDAISGDIKTASFLDRETKANILLNIQATSGNPPIYGHTQVNIDIEDTNDNAPEFESNIVRISVPENIEVGIPIYEAHAVDPDAGLNGTVHYRIVNSDPLSDHLFQIDSSLGYLTLIRQLDYETTQRHNFVIIASDMGIPSLSSNLSVLLEVQDFNDNAPVFEKIEYRLQILESLSINSQILQVTATDLDTGNNARLTYKILPTNSTIWSDINNTFGIFPNSGWIYLRGNLDRETKDHYNIQVVATDNGTPPESATTRVIFDVLDANDNDPLFDKEIYKFSLEEGLSPGSSVGRVSATDKDKDANAMIRYFLVPNNSSFYMNSVTGEITTKEILDREKRQMYDLTAEARDQGTPPRSTRVPVKITVLDINDNAPEIVDPAEDVVSVREAQSPGTEVVRVKAIDPDLGANSTITYSILNVFDSDGRGAFSIDSTSGVIRTRMVLDHEEKNLFRLTVAATDGGNPPMQSTKRIRIEVIDLSDSRPTFTSSNLYFKVSENANIGHIVGALLPDDISDNSNMLSDRTVGHVTYDLVSTMKDNAFDIDQKTGSLVVSRLLDRESKSEYNFEIRVMDTSSINNPQSSAITIKIDIADTNDNAPLWLHDPITVSLKEDTSPGTVIYNFTAIDKDSGENAELRYNLVKEFPDGAKFAIDAITGALILKENIDYELLQEYILVVSATDQAINASERLSSSVTARIKIIDCNDNAPKFVLPLDHSIDVFHSTPVGITITQFVAIDYDSQDNGKITYAIYGGNEFGLFALGYDSGTLSLVKPFPMIQTTYTLNVTAMDHGVPNKQSFLELKITMQLELNNSPKYVNTIYHATVLEDAPVGTFVTTINARAGLVGNDENLAFFIPIEMSDNAFNVDSRGRVLTKTPLDRETRQTYNLPVYLSQMVNQEQILHDVGSLVVTVEDVNDNAPTFQEGSCYPLSLPENSESSIIHTVAAEDTDEGLNGQISYSISSGNVGNKFSIDAETGELRAQLLDRERQAKYYLVVTAQDKGNPPLRSDCNITILVEDQNDNGPIFDLSNYSAMIDENVPVGTSVLKVHASDADVGFNGRVVYSLANESQWLFRIDNKSGIITTAGLFDREKQNSYAFDVIATDGGKYNARSQKVSINVKIGDVNDNKPIFTEYPFVTQVSTYVQPGKSIVQVSANDADEGINAEIVYSLVNGEYSEKFRVNPTNGLITTTQSLASQTGEVIYLNVLATDKGNPPRNSMGLVEVIVGEKTDSASLKFQQSNYEITLPENAEAFYEIIQVLAISSDGRKQRIQYSFGTGNEMNVFEINQENGSVYVKDSKTLDYELYKEIKLVIEAKSIGSYTHRGYCTLLVKLTDQNDNAPKFNQQQYTASVWEGNNKGAFVLQLQAFDADEGQNSKILYHIVDGNHDNAFKIEPEFSGTLKTNIVLDREIRDSYRLTIIATDRGIPQMTGTAKVLINIVDVNDNQPTFPQSKVIEVREDSEVGTVLTVIAANDVDTNPSLTYSLGSKSDNDDSKYFSIDRFTGKIVLAKALDYEYKQELKLTVLASDIIHVTSTTLTIKVVDVNDNPPVFSQTSYLVTISDCALGQLIQVAEINSTDADSGDNGKILYNLLNQVSGFSIGLYDGVIHTNLSDVTPQHNDIYLIVKATDMGTPSLHAIAFVKVRINCGLLKTPENVKEYRLQLPEDTRKGTVVLHLDKDYSAQDRNFEIVSGNEDGIFILSTSGVLLLLKSLNREIQNTYTLKVATDVNYSKNFSIINVHIEVEDVNDNAPVFNENSYRATIEENSPIGTSVIKVKATDKDSPNSLNSQIQYDITSGNDHGGFKLDSSTGILYVNKLLDCDLGPSKYNVVLRACDKGKISLCTVSTLAVNLQDVNDNSPVFPVAEILEFVVENEAVGSAVFTAHATDLDKDEYGSLNYTIQAASTNFDDDWKLFNIDAATGLVSTNTIFDYETRNKYYFVINAKDAGGKSGSVKVKIEVEDKDEYYPQFSERTYKFTLTTSVSLPVGYLVGYVAATDRDKGPCGKLIYQLTAQHKYFKINRTTGAIVIKKKFSDLDLAESEKGVHLLVTASSGKQGSLTNMTVVEINFDPSSDPGLNLAVNRDNDSRSPQSNGIADWVLGLLIALIFLVVFFGALFVFLHMKNKRKRNVSKSNLNTETVTSSNSYVDRETFDTIPIRSSSNSATSNNHFAPPKYDEIPPYGGIHTTSSNSGAATTSELSGSEQSGSSGRGSAEDGDDGEDEEIRMINEGPMQRESGILRQDDNGDNLSNISVRNTQEYLARLGIVNNSSIRVPQTISRLCSDVRSGSNKDLHHHATMQIDTLDIFDEENGDNGHIDNFYAKLNVASAEKNSSTLGSTMDHVLAIGGYGDVPSVTHQPSMNGSLSSIVHSEEELAGSYNWDYLLDWGPQYQPLAHVFSEIARLKDDTASLKSAASGNSSIKSKNSVTVSKTIPPPLITNVAPRSIAIPTLNSRTSSHNVTGNQMLMLPRSPINHDGSGATFSSSTVMSPSFSPSLSPLATKSPSISPLVPSGLPNTHHVMPRQVAQNRNKAIVDTELRI